MLKVGSRLEVTCIDINYLGKGVCRHEDLVIFVDNLIDNEQALIEITSVKKRYLLAKVIKRLNNSPKRVGELSELGSINLAHLSVDAQNDWQLQISSNAISKALKENITIDKIITNEISNVGYRNKLVYHNLNDEHVIKLGLYDTNYQLVIVNDFILAPKHINNLIKQINDANIKQDPVLKHLVIRTNELEQMLVTLVVSDKKNHLNKLIMLLNNNKNVVGITISVNPKTYEILGSKSRLITGINEIKMELNNIKIPINDLSFFQVNSEVASKTIQTISKYVNQNKTVIDAYSGVGAIGFNISQNSKEVYLIDNNLNNINSANNYIEQNKINNVKTILGDVVNEISLIDADILIVDPPRKGLSEELVTKLLDKPFERIIYLSCDLNSLTQNLIRLNDKYQINDIYGVRMFSHTTSIETLVILDRR